MQSGQCEGGELAKWKTRMKETAWGLQESEAKFQNLPVLSRTIILGVSSVSFLEFLHYTIKPLNS